MKLIKNTHDLQLSDWGPYSKKYAGISHVANSELGLRFDLSVFPGLYRRRTELPHCLFETNYHIWEASPNLDYFTTRHELEWKDKVYSDVSYSKIDDNCYAVRANCFNNTDTIQNLVIHYMASMQYPLINAKADGGVILPVEYNIPEDATLVHAIDFEEFFHEVIRPQDTLVADGYRRGELRKEDFYRGSAVVLGEEKGDKIIYSLGSVPNKKFITVRVLNTSNDTATIMIDGCVNAKIDVLVSNEIQVISVPVAINLDAEPKFTVVCDNAIVNLDGFVFSDDASKVDIKVADYAFLPESYERGSDVKIDYAKDRDLHWDKPFTCKEENMIIQKYEHSDYYYGIAWDYEDFNIRYIMNDELDEFLKIQAQNHVLKVIDGNMNGAFTNLFIRPIPINPSSSAYVDGAVCCGNSYEEVKEKLTSILKDTSVLAKAYETQSKKALKVEPNKFGDKYKFSQDMMIATTLSNVVYPIYTKRSYIKHNTPGSWWDSLYTWDSGFCGLGLSACDMQRAIDCLNAYVTEPGDEETAFIHHGTPLPVQFYLFQDIYNQTQSRELLEYFYPRLKQYFLFMAGKLGSSNMAKFKSGMLCTWEYFYNSAGWDDYPPQMDVHHNNRTGYVSCVSNTSQAIRCAKIMKQTANLLGINDIAMYDEIIENLTKAVQEKAWDSESGYFSYLVHDENMEKKDFLRHESGQNYNMGLDGTTPMVAGVLTDEQLEIIVDRLMDPERLMTDVGLSTVDKTAKYFLKDGYWNGSVWFPHQWFYFKALLDYGYTDEAFTIADKALSTWENEVKASYSCFEHFLILSKRGAGWHHFSGLSTPILKWFESYYKIGTVTAGHGVLVENKEFSEDYTSASLSLNFADDMKNTAVIVVMNSDYRYKVTVDGKEVDFTTRFDGVLELKIPTKSLNKVTIDIDKL